jgi:hypothetical protein
MEGKKHLLVTEYCRSQSRAVWDEALDRLDAEIVGSNPA